MTPAEFVQTISTIVSPTLPGHIPYNRKYTINIKKKYEDTTLLHVYHKVMPHIAKDEWEEQILSGDILLEGKKVSPSQTVKGGQITSRVIKNITEPTIATDLQLIHLEQDFLILNKPAPLPVHPAGRFNKNTLTYLLEQAFPKQSFHLVHRLDANTTGLLIIALNQETATYFIDQFSKKNIIKEYFALVEGNPTASSFTLTDSISKEKNTSGSRTLENGLHAETFVEVIEKRKNACLVKVHPSTGRTNQIRLHLAKNGLPIVGDYGYKDETYFENNPMTYEQDCLFLHAHQLTFNHPQTNNQITFNAPIPEKFTTYL